MAITFTITAAESNVRSYFRKSLLLLSNYENVLFIIPLF